MATLIVVSGPSTGDYYPLGHRTLVAGRQETCPLQIVDEKVSRKHLQIRYDASDAGYHALDMNSANGTFVNDRRLEAEVVLQDEDEIHIGESILFFTTKDFPDHESALNHYKQVGQRFCETIDERKPGMPR